VGQKFFADRAKKIRMVLRARASLVWMGFDYRPTRTS
jgi:hypothetical protein